MSLPVRLCTRQYRASLSQLFGSYGLRVERIETGNSIPGSYWGDSEAGLIGDALFLRDDTPLHSALHEGCHYICMDEARRAVLHTDAGGDIPEENAVCYLQSLLANDVRDYDSERLWADMDSWGYSFRLGSARAWFEQDAADACSWLQTYRLIDPARRPTGHLRS
jgi:hypothetical protein